MATSLGHKRVGECISLAREKGISALQKRLAELMAEEDRLDQSLKQVIELQYQYQTKHGIPGKVAVNRGERSIDQEVEASLRWRHAIAC